MKKKISNLNLEDPKDWVLSKIICNQCNQNPDFEIIEFVNGQKWTYKNPSYNEFKLEEGYV